MIVRVSATAGVRRARGQHGSMALSNRATYVSNASIWEQRSFTVNHLGEVTSVHEDAFDSPLEDEDGNPKEVSEDDLEPDDWGWPYWGCFDSDADIYAGAK